MQVDDSTRANDWAGAAHTGTTGEAMAASIVARLSQQLTHVGAVSAARIAARCVPPTTAPPVAVSLDLPYDVGMFMPASSHLHYLAGALQQPQDATAKRWAFYVLPC
jgi:hypothetical protein